MKILVTGAGGFIASNLALKLAESGTGVRALYRSKISAGLHHPNIELIQGDILDAAVLEKAAGGCEKIFHVAALANNWAKNSRQFYDVNVAGTENVLRAGKKTGVKKIVVTSTAGTIGPSPDGNPVTEKQSSTLFGHYEKSKKKSEDKALEFVEKGMDIVIVNPTRVFGPGELSKSNAVTKIIHKYIEKKWKFIPGNGENIGNYAFVEDVVNGHRLAMEKGKAGERYLLGGHNASFNEFINIVSEVSGIKNKLATVPLGLIGIFGLAEDIAAGIFGREPQITYAWVKKYKANWTTSTEKAEKELGYTVTPLKEAVKKTIKWLKDNSDKKEKIFQ